MLLDLDSELNTESSGHPLADDAENADTGLVPVQIPNGVAHVASSSSNSLDLLSDIDQ